MGWARRRRREARQVARHDARASVREQIARARLERDRGAEAERGEARHVGDVAERRWGHRARRLREPDRHARMGDETGGVRSHRLLDAAADVHDRAGRSAVRDRKQRARDVAHVDQIARRA